LTTVSNRRSTRYPRRDRRVNQPHAVVLVTLARPLDRYARRTDYRVLTQRMHTPATLIRMDPGTELTRQTENAPPDSTDPGGEQPGRHILEALFGWWMAEEHTHSWPHY